MRTFDPDPDINPENPAGDLAFHRKLKCRRFEQKKIELDVWQARNIPQTATTVQESVQNPLLGVSDRNNAGNPKRCALQAAPTMVAISHNNLCCIAGQHPACLCAPPAHFFAKYRLHLREHYFVK